MSRHRGMPFGTARPAASSGDRPGTGRFARFMSWMVLPLALLPAASATAQVPPPIDATLDVLFPGAGFGVQLEDSSAFVDVPPGTPFSPYGGPNTVPLDTSIAGFGHFRVDSSGGDVAEFFGSGAPFACGGHDGYQVACPLTDDGTGSPFAAGFDVFVVNLDSPFPGDTTGAFNYEIFLGFDGAFQAVVPLDLFILLGEAYVVRYVDGWSDVELLFYQDALGRFVSQGHDTRVAITDDTAVWVVPGDETVTAGTRTGIFATSSDRPGQPDTVAALTFPDLPAGPNTYRGDEEPPIVLLFSDLEPVIVDDDTEIIIEDDEDEPLIVIDDPEPAVVDEPEEPAVVDDEPIAVVDDGDDSAVADGDDEDAVAVGDDDSVTVQDETPATSAPDDREFALWWLILLLVVAPPLAWFLLRFLRRFLAARKEKQEDEPQPEQETYEGGIVGHVVGTPEEDGWDADDETTTTDDLGTTTTTTTTTTTSTTTTEETSDETTDEGSPQPAPVPPNDPVILIEADSWITVFPRKKTPPECLRLWEECRELRRLAVIAQERAEAAEEEARRAAAEAEEAEQRAAERQAHVTDLEGRTDAPQYLSRMAEAQQAARDADSEATAAQERSQEAMTDAVQATAEAVEAQAAANEACARARACEEGSK